VGENGGIFCHANTWAIIAEALLGNGERAFKYYRQLLPDVLSEKAGADHYGREPYVFVSSIVGPASERFGEGGISWLTGTANWMAIAATQYLLGVRPEYDGLRLRPCLPAALRRVEVRRLFRGCRYEIELEQTGRGMRGVWVEGRKLEGDLAPVSTASVCRVRCEC
jgi:cellobiose phosphorylase